MEHICPEKISKCISELSNLSEEGTIAPNHNYYKLLRGDNFNFKNQLKNKRAYQFQYLYDIQDPLVKKILFTDNRLNIDKFKALISSNIYLSMKIRSNKYTKFIDNDFEEVFKDLSIKYIEENGGDFVIEKSDLQMKLETFDKAYNLAFKDNSDKHRRFQKCKLKKQYKKYLEQGIDDCALKEQLYLIIALINFV